MKRLKRFAGRGAVGALALYLVVLCVSAFWMDWHDLSEDTHGIAVVFAAILVPITAVIGAGVGACAALLVYLNEQS